MEQEIQIALSTWIDGFETQCSVLLQTADKLLHRYPRLRRRPGVSPAGRILYPCLLLLQGLSSFLSGPEVLRLATAEKALTERFSLLSRRKIPYCPELRRLHSQCRKLLSIPKLPDRWTSPSVLVGTLRTPQQLDVCLECGFYHVPACHIPQDRLPISYVAIYQSRSLFPEDCGIRFYGRVKGCTPVRRWQISEIPKNSDELYYRLEVDAWEQLEAPIQIRELPINHLFTNLFLLEHSRDIPELSLETPAQFLSYQALRHSLELGDGTVLHHPRGKVQLKKGRFLIHRHGRQVAVFCAEDFIQTPSSTFRELMDILKH